MTTTQIVWIITISCLTTLCVVPLGVYNGQQHRHEYYTSCTAKGGTVIEDTTSFYCIDDKSIIRIQNSLKR